MLVFFSFTACQSADSGQKGYFVEYEINAAQLYIDGKKISDTEYRALNAAAGELIRSIEREISVEFPDSDLSEINAAGAYEPVAVGEHTYRMLELCGELHSLTAGKFSPALYNLSEIWGFSPDCEGKYNVSRPEPSLMQIETALAGSDFSDLELLDGQRVQKKNAALKLDLGGIAKGYMSDCLRALLEERFRGKKVEGSVSVMSNTILLGNYHESAQSTRPWKVSVDNPRARVTPYMQCMMLPEVSSAAITTSSDMYRFYSYGGKIYCHIFDPETGRPADRGIISITVVVPNTVPDCGALADALSTAGFCMDLTDSLNFYGRLSESLGVSAVVICSDFQFYTIGDLSVLNMSEVSESYTDVFTRGAVSDAADRVIPCEKEKEYISKCERT